MFVLMIKVAKPFMFMLMFRGFTLFAFIFGGSKPFMLMCMFMLRGSKPFMFAFMFRRSKPFMIIVRLGDLSRFMFQISAKPTYPWVPLAPRRFFEVIAPLLPP